MVKPAVVFYLCGGLIDENMSTDNLRSDPAGSCYDILVEQLHLQLKVYLCTCWKRPTIQGLSD